jgi:hypothetical protein
VKLDKHAGWIEQARTAALGLPLLLVLLAALFAALPERYRLAGFPQFGGNYPIRFDLGEVQAATEQRDLAERRAAASRELGQGTNLSGELLINQLLVTPIEGGEQAALTTLTAEGGADQSRSSNAMPALITRNSGLQGIMAIEFDLEGGPNSSSTVATSKDVQHEGQVIGQIGIRVDNNSAIYVARADVLRIVPSVPVDVERLEEDFILISTLRNAGVNLRYDPIGDSLVLAD